MCGAKDTFGIIWQPEVCGAHLLRLSMRSEGRVVPQHGGGQPTPSDWHVLSTPLTLGVPTQLPDLKAASLCL